MDTFTKMERRLDKMPHECDRSQLTTRVAGGDFEKGPGISVWACEACANLKYEIIREAFKDVRFEGGPPHRRRVTP